MTGWLVVGVGNDFRGDDAAGCFVARELDAHGGGSYRAVEHQSDGTALLRLFGESENIILVDAVTSGKPVGTIHRLDLLKDTIPANFIHNSSHLFGVPEAVALARELQQLPSRLIFYGIEASSFGTGSEITPSVRAAAGTIVQLILEETRAI